MKILVILIFTATTLITFPFFRSVFTPDWDDEVIVQQEVVKSKSTEKKVVKIQKKVKDTFPKKHWDVYSFPEDAGFSAKRLKAVSNYYDHENSASLLIVKNGRIVLSLGDNTRRFMTHSIRKTFLNALYGKHINQIDTSETLGALNIDDIQKLTEIEKRARVIDLLASRSGIYHPSVYSPQSMTESLPERGSHEPGSYWFYNNWDFNALGSIFRLKTNQDIFEAFKRDIAEPLQMEDFRLVDTYYRKESEKSIHDAYLFKMSSRDLARFGLLYLKKGKWMNQQILSQHWVERSTNPYLKEPLTEKGSYGLLWRISPNIKEEPMYYTSGLNGHRLYIFPKSDMLVVHRTNTYIEKKVSEDYLKQLLNLIVTAKEGYGNKRPATTMFTPENALKKEITETPCSAEFDGMYSHPFLGRMTVKAHEHCLLLETNIGLFNMYRQGENQFLVEDMMIPLTFTKAENDKQRYTVKANVNEKRELKSVVFYY